MYIYAVVLISNSNSSAFMVSETYLSKDFEVMQNFSEMFANSDKKMRIFSALIDEEQWGKLQKPKTFITGHIGKSLEGLMRVGDNMEIPWKNKIEFNSVDDLNAIKVYLLQVFAKNVATIPDFAGKKYLPNNQVNFNFFSTKKKHLTTLSNNYTKDHLIQIIQVQLPQGIVNNATIKYFNGGKTLVHVLNADIAIPTKNLCSGNQYNNIGSQKLKSNR